MELANGDTMPISRTGVYVYQVDAGTGTADLTLTDQSGNLVTPITNAAQSADFTGELNLGVGQVVTAVITGDAKIALTFADVG